jgi:hypothetical protein
MHSLRKDAAALVSVFVLVAAIIGMNPFRQTLAPMDLLLAYPGWQNTGVETPLVNEERSDALDHRLPNWRYFRERLRSGHVPTWNPLNQLGAPGIQVPIFEALSLPFVIFATIPNEAVGYSLAIISNFMIAAFGAYFLLYFMFGIRAAAIFGAITFAFCGFNIAWAHWPHLTTSALIPWVLASELRLWQTGHARWLPVFALSVALLTLAGFPFVAEWGLIAAGLLGCFLVVSALRDRMPARTMLMRSGCLGAAGLAGLLMAAPGLLQVLDVLSRTDLSYRSGGTPLNSSDLKYLLGLDFFYRIGVERTFSSGTTALLLAAFGFGLTWIRSQRFAAFGAALGFVSTCIAYGIFSPVVIRLIPGFDFNPWNRSGVVTAMSIAILAAFALSWLVRHAGLVASRTLITTVILLATVQLHWNFSVMNAKPSIDTYFPMTHAIASAQDELQPLPSVLASNAFLFSGTVSNYGLPELFAHGFRTKAQTRALKDISPTYKSTPTASFLDCQSLNYDSPYLAYASVRLLLQTKNCLSKSIEPIKGMGQRPSEPLNSGALKGNFRLNADMRVDSISFLLSTYKVKYAPAPVRLRIYSGTTVIAERTIRADAVRDNAYAVFMLDSPINLPGGLYTYELSLVGAASAEKLSVWTYVEAGGYKYSVGKKIFDGAPKLLLNMPRVKLPRQFIIQNEEQNIIIIINSAVTGSAYYVASLTGSPVAEYSHVSLSSYTVKDIIFRYSGHRAGWIVAPIRADRNWRAIVSGRPVKPTLFKGVFLSVHVSDASEVRFYYDDSGIVAGFATFAFAGTAVLLLAMCAAIYWK